MLIETDTELLTILGLARQLDLLIEELKSTLTLGFAINREK